MEMSVSFKLRPLYSQGNNARYQPNLDVSEMRLIAWPSLKSNTIPGLFYCSLAIAAHIIGNNFKHSKIIPSKY